MSIAQNNSRATLSVARLVAVVFVLGCVWIVLDVRRVRAEVSCFGKSSPNGRFGLGDRLQVLFSGYTE